MAMTLFTYCHNKMVTHFKSI